MIKYQEPEVADPFTLEPGDQIGFNDAGPRLQVMVGGQYAEDAVWVDLVDVDRPGRRGEKTGEIVAGDQVGLRVRLPFDAGYIVGVFPLVLARRVIR